MRKSEKEENPKTQLHKTNQNVNSFAFPPPLTPPLTPLLPTSLSQKKVEETFFKQVRLA